MSFPAILTGAAGRARVALQPLETMATHVDDVLAHAPHAAGGDLGLQVTGSRHWLVGSEAKDLVNAARQDLGEALGRTRQPAFSAELHAATRQLGTDVAAIERRGLSAPDGATLERVHGATGQVHAAMAELDAAAQSHARSLIAAGGTLAAVSAAFGGFLVIDGARGGRNPDFGDDHTKAPGPSGFHPNPEHQY